MTALKIKVACQSCAARPPPLVGYFGEKRSPRQPPILEEALSRFGALDPGFTLSAFRGWWEPSFREVGDAIPAPVFPWMSPIHPRPAAPGAVASSLPRPERGGRHRPPRRDSPERRGCRPGRGRRRGGQHRRAGFIPASVPRPRAGLGFLFFTFFLFFFFVEWPDNGCAEPTLA